MSSISQVKVWGTEVLTSNDLNAWFSEIRTKVNSFAAWQDEANTFTQIQTFNPGSGTAISVANGGIAITAGGLTISADGIAVTGNSTITGTLGGLTGLTVASGGITVASGGITVTAGGVAIAAGNLILSDGQAAPTRFNKGDVSGVVAIDLNDGNRQRLRLTGNITSLTLNNPIVGADYVLELIQDGTGSRTVTWPATVKWSGNVTPSLTTTPSRKDIIGLYWTGTNFDAWLVANAIPDTT